MTLCYDYTAMECLSCESNRFWPIFGKVGYRTRLTLCRKTTDYGCVKGYFLNGNTPTAQLWTNLNISLAEVIYVNRPFLCRLVAHLFVLMSSSVFVNARFLTQPITGTQRYAIELCRGLKQLRPDVILVAPDNIIHKDLAEELDVQVIGKIRKGIVWEQMELPFLLRRRGSPLLVNLCNLAPIAYNNNIVTVLDLSFKLHPEWFSRRFALLYNFFIPRELAGARRVITISENSKQDIAQHYGVPLSKIDIVYPSVPTVFIEAPAQKQPNLYGSYVLAVSSIDPRKNFAGLIKAFKAGNFGEN